MSLRPLRRAAVLVRFVAWLILELLLANARVAGIVLRPKSRYHPALLRVRPPVSSDRVLVGLADLITLTPGTLAVEVDTTRREILVHTIDGLDPDAVRRTILQEYTPRMEALLS